VGKIKRTKRVRFVSTIALLLSVASANTWAAECGRTQWAQLNYRYFSDYGDHPRSTDVRVIRIVSSNRADKNEITVAVRFEAVNGRNNDQNAISTDGGETWVGTADPIPSNLGFVPNWFVESPSNVNFQYRYIEGLDLYVRSDDGGKSWILPAYFIDGETKEKFAEKIGGSKSFHAQMFLDGVDPKEPKTVYASIKLTPWIRTTEKLNWKNMTFVYQSLDGGEHWIEFNKQLEGFPVSLGGGSPVAINPNDSNIYFGVGAIGLLKSSDAGKTWHPVGQNTELIKRPLYASEQGGAARMLGAPAGIEVYQFAFDPHQVGVTYVVANKGLFRSVDGGQSWRLLDLGFDEIDSINSIGVSPLDSKQLYVGTRYGIFRSDDSGCSFQKIYPPSSKKVAH